MGRIDDDDRRNVDEKRNSQSNEPTIIAETDPTLSRRRDQQIDIDDAGTKPGLVRTQHERLRWSISTPR